MCKSEKEGGGGGGGGGRDSRVIKAATPFFMPLVL